MAQLTLEMPESAFGTLHPFTESAEKTAWVFSDGGIRNIPTTTGFSSRVSRHLQGTGRRLRGASWFFAEGSPECGFLLLSIP
jgi:hypothetical protein